ncbi:PIN domain-containing protein [Methanosphaera sp. ISO3-F5]|uniref:type II toxin-antitoxin system VapC family toxin n=1 Tax=Methanosphaera sp. ISO3-F5 TaxID=1452353 RepID=UPI002B25C0C3|nr:PIN domain-containing protein [Methanosphaera sp. ISO3-F5]WQH64352.1 PIN domain-containing protein [Methanosphaera sp. ISO3-F5]
MILVDSNYMIALMNNKEKNHKRAVKLASRVDNDEKIMPILMLSEAVTSIGSRKKGKEAKLLYDTLIDNFEIYFPTLNEIDTAMQCVLKYDGTLALADCLAILIMKKRGITEIVSFDDDFDKVEGIVRIH